MWPAFLTGVVYASGLITPLACRSRAEPLTEKTPQAAMIRDARASENDSSIVVVVDPTPVRSDDIAIRRTLGRAGDFVSVSGMLTLGALLVVADQLMDPHLAVIDRRTGVTTHFLGHHGVGADQLFDPVCPHAAADAPPMIWVYDYTQRRIVLSQLDLSGADYIRETVQLRTGVLACALWNNGRLIGVSSGKGAALIVMDRNGHEIARHRPARFAHDSATLRPGMLVARPNQSRLALSYRGTARIDVFHPSGVVERSIETALPKRPATAPSDGADETYLSIVATDRFIYALVGVARSSKEASTGQTVHVLDWSGRLAHVIRLDRPISAFALGDDERELYGAFHGSPNAPPVIGEWMMPHWSTPSGGVSLASDRGALPDARPGQRTVTK